MEILSQPASLRHQSPLKRHSSQLQPEVPTRPPRDEVELRGDSSQTSTAKVLGAVAMMTAVGAIVAVLSPGAAISVQELGPALAVRSQQQDQQEALRFEVLPNAAGKIDLVRHRVVEEDGQGGSRSVDRPLSPLGVYLGHGLFLDSNQNISFVPSRLLQGPVIEVGQELRIGGDLSALVRQQGDHTEVERWGHDFSAQRINPDHLEFQVGAWDSTLQVVRSGNTLRVEGGRFEIPLIITAEGNRVSLRQQGSWSIFEQTLERHGQDFLVQRPFALGGNVRVNWEDGQLKYREQGSLETVVQRGQNGIVTDHGGLFTESSTLDLRAGQMRETGPEGNFTYKPPAEPQP